MHGELKDGGGGVSRFCVNARADAPPLARHRYFRGLCSRKRVIVSFFYFGLMALTIGLCCVPGMDYRAIIAALVCQKVPHATLQPARTLLGTHCTTSDARADRMGIQPRGELRLQPLRAPRGPSRGGGAAAAQAEVLRRQGLKWRYKSRDDEVSCCVMTI